MQPGSKPKQQSSSLNRILSYVRMVLRLVLGAVVISKKYLYLYSVVVSASIAVGAELVDAHRK